VIGLRPEEFSAAFPLYRAAGLTFPLISAVLQGVQRGQVLADRRESPHAAAIVTRFGFTFVAGEADSAFDGGLAQVLASADVLEPSRVLWYAPPESWRARLDAVPDGVRRRERARLQFSEERATWLHDPPPIPEPFALETLTPDLLPATEPLGLDVASRFWSSAEDYEANGFGVCLVGERGVAAICYAATVVDGLAEVDVVTDSELRGRGLGFALGQAFIGQCLSTGVRPTWDCFLDNAGSVRLAVKLGFVPAATYPFYSFQLPLAV
jgi:GNAT superfamily N-acetyltransferase